MAQTTRSDIEWEQAQLSLAEVALLLQGVGDGTREVVVGVVNGNPDDYYDSDAEHTLLLRLPLVGAELRWLLDHLDAVTEGWA